jgi:hypothetical protein
MDLLSRASEPAYPMPPAELPEAPRPTEFTLLSQVYRGIALAAFLIAPVVILYIGHEYYVKGYRDLADHGQKTDAVVTKRYTTSDSDSGTDYWIVYHYQANGRSFEQRSSVSSEQYSQTHEGGSVVITYLPEDPTNCCVGRAADQVDRVVNEVLIGAAVISLVFAAWFLYQHIAMNRELYLARNGTPVVGNITLKDSIKQRNGYKYQAGYKFTADDGSASSSGTGTLSKDVWDYLCPGLPVTVLYLPDNPRRCQLLCGFKHIRFLRERSEEEAEDRGEADMSA